MASFVDFCRADVSGLVPYGRSVRALGLGLEGRVVLLDETLLPLVALYRAPHHWSAHRGARHGADGGSACGLQTPILSRQYHAAKCAGCTAFHHEKRTDLDPHSWLARAEHGLYSGGSWQARQGDFQTDGRCESRAGKAGAIDHLPARHPRGTGGQNALQDGHGSPLQPAGARLRARRHQRRRILAAQRRLPQTGARRDRISADHKTRP